MYNIYALLRSARFTTTHNHAAVGLIIQRHLLSLGEGAIILSFMTIWTREGEDLFAWVLFIVGSVAVHGG